MDVAVIIAAAEMVEEAERSEVPFFIIGGSLALYAIMISVYGFKKPNPFPGWFGFHEVFHSLTIAAFVTHYAGVSIATYSLR